MVLVIFNGIVRLKPVYFKGIFIKHQLIIEELQKVCPSLNSDKVELVKIWLKKK